MTEYRITVSKESLSFAAGHFITYGGGACETLHGHNYRVGVCLVGDLDEHALVYDFVVLKGHMNVLLEELDHRMLLPTRNRELQLVRSGEELEVHHAGRRYVFPVSDTVSLPVTNTTAERLAEYLCDRLATQLRDSGARNITRIEMEVEESYGQSALCIRDLSTGPDLAG
jgi:6-pyruvoyltetrahydropterin/6-carboxytetrahydropterin synthase